ncbi:hypothetical protein, partial [Natronomonas sp.]|uniref:hypothetical protein n=1 Tax=Natronomonas sp. TaxID=2184060 RepID=UPI002FC28F98
MRRVQQVSVTLMTTLLVTSLVAAFVTFGAAPASAAHPEDVNDVTDSSNFTVNFPSATDHYPGDKNTENGSIEYFVVGSDAFAEMGAEDGLYFNWIIIHAEYEGVDWIDYSACTTDNTEAFGIDRGNNNSGTQYDVDLVARQKQESDHQTGDQNPQNASIHHFAETGSGFDGKPADRLEVMKWLVISSDEIDFSGCGSADTEALGIDRGSNNSGTQNDDSILQNMLDSGFQEDKIWVEFNGEDDFGETVSISREDSIVAVQSDCYTMPEDPGWYQISGKINGTGPDGNFFEVTLDSHYFATYAERLSERLSGVIDVPIKQRPGGVSDWSPLYNEIEDTDCDVAIIGMALGGT